MLDETDNLRILAIKELDSPATIYEETPQTDASMRTVTKARRAIHNILHQDDDRLIVVIGPCSIHDPQAALDYAERLVAQRAVFAGSLEIIMRVYFEKPRTTVGWKGLINDPLLDGSFEINRGLRIARHLLSEVNKRGVPAGCEFLDIMTPQYIADLVSWGAIGARTTESQVHRQMASGLSCAIGFKNATNGDVAIAVDAMLAASNPHHFLAITKAGQAAIAATIGNDECHVILRGGPAPNYDAASIKATRDIMRQAGLPPRIMVDASHANSRKNPDKQPQVIADIAEQIRSGDESIIGVMVESHLVAGRQDLSPGQPLTYGQSITDGCLGWDESIRVLHVLADAVDERRQKSKQTMK